MPMTFAESIAQAAQGAACAILAVNDGINGFLEGIVSGGSLGFQDVTRSIRRQFCNNPDDTVPVPEPEFTGGQCPKLYDGTYTTRFVRSSGQVDNPVNRAYSDIRGPLRSVPYFTLNGPGFRVQIDHTDSQGNPTTTVLVSSGSNNPNYVSMQLSNYSIVTADGSPDNCGNPPSPPVPPYIPTPTTVNIEYEDNSQTTINEDVDITVFAPFVAIGGAIFAPITISGNTFNLAGELQLSPEFKLEVNPELSISPRGNVDTTPPSPGEPVPEPPGPADRRVIVGVIVTATNVGNIRASQIGQGNNPDIFAPRVANVNFYIATDKGQAWTNDIPVKNLRAYIPCPVDFGAVDVAATAEPGFTIATTPVWSSPTTSI